MEKHVVMSDLHGQADLLRKVVDYYDNDVEYLVNGDVIDRGKNSKGLVSLLMEIGARVNKGNHEWVLQAALSDIDSQRRNAWQVVWLGVGGQKLGYENLFLLRSYGLERLPRRTDTAQALKETMREAGHWQWLVDTEMYTETDELLVVHAGLKSTVSWQQQRRKLDAIQAMQEARIFLDEPSQLFDYEFSNDWGVPKDLDKVLITGHTHRGGKAEARVYPSPPELPHRVQLASNLAIGMPLYVYENWTGQVREFSQD